MRYYLDTEFVDDGRAIQLISIGIVAENGREFYAEVDEFQPASAPDWIKKNVVPKLIGDVESRHSIRDRLLKFIGEDENVQFWANYCSYDFVCLCQIFGPMMDLPTKWPKFCHDLQHQRGRHPLIIQRSGHHNALDDAHYVRDAHNAMMGISSAVA